MNWEGANAAELQDARHGATKMLLVLLALVMASLALGFHVGYAIGAERSTVEVMRVGGGNACSANQ